MIIINTGDGLVIKHILKCLILLTMPQATICQWWLTLAGKQNCTLYKRVELGSWSRCYTAL